MANGNVFEKAGVAVSVVHGTMPQEALHAATERGVNRARAMGHRVSSSSGSSGSMNPNQPIQFFACGISSVIHPRNPHAPTMHFNFRYFETENGLWWFGGGADITPAYLVPGDVKHFHGTLKRVCDKHDPGFYPTFKAWADEYFIIKHRNETRGLGRRMHMCMRVWIESMYGIL